MERKITPLKEAEGTLTAPRNLIEAMHWPVEQAMTVIGIPESEWPKYRELLKEN